MTISLLIAAVLLAPRQSEPLAQDERQTSILELKDGSELPVFWGEQEEKSTATILRVELDTPWQPGTTTVARTNIVRVRTELSSKRRERHARGWREAGYVDIDGRHILQSEKELADRARTMAGLPPIEETSAAGAAPPPEPVSVAAPEAAAPGPAPNPSRAAALRPWLPHAATVLGALLLGALIYRAMIRS